MDLLDGRLLGKRVAIVGKLGGLTKKDTLRLIRQHGGRVDDRPSDLTELIVIGADQPPTQDWAMTFDVDVARGVRDGRIEVLEEPDLWLRLGMVATDVERGRQLYTPAMLADLLGISVRVVRRWLRAGLIRPVEEIHRLPYFDYQEVSTAKQLAQWMTEGATVQGIQRQLAALSELVPVDGRPLRELSIFAEGKRLLLRQDDGLIESSGQLCMDFDTIDEQLQETLGRPATISLATLMSARQSSPLSPEPIGPPVTLDEMLAEAVRAEDDDMLDVAIEWYRAALAGHGVSADISFQIAELLYRTGDVSAARERYYVALEMNPDLVEARANLGCVLAELGQLELAIAAFEGTLNQYEEYADVHYHLARALDEANRPSRALEHWQRFLQLAPASPWADEARERVEHSSQAGE